MVQLLFYDNVTRVSSQSHADLCIEKVNYDFAANVNSVPLTAVEIPVAAADYTIVFAGNEENVTPIVILGLEGSKNEYVDSEGKWAAIYVPGFVRRYPFVFAEAEGEDGKKVYTLCVDESSAACNREGKGERLFDEAGERTEYLGRLLKFLEEYQGHVVRTQTFCDTLRELKVLEPAKIDIRSPSGEKKTLGGFLAVNRQKLKDLSPEKLAELAKTDELELIYLHLHSMTNLRRILERTAAQNATTEPDAD